MCEEVIVDGKMLARYGNAFTRWWNVVADLGVELDRDARAVLIVMANQYAEELEVARAAWESHIQVAKKAMETMSNAGS